MGTLTNTTAVITGASSGVGKAIALALAGEGMHLCLVGRNRTTLEEIAELAKNNTRSILCYQADLTQDDHILGLSTFLKKNFSSLDILVHSAGLIERGSIMHAPVQDFDRQYRTNVRAPYLLTQVLLPLLKSAQGQVVFINSSLGLVSRGEVGQYAATKHAVKALADSLRDEVNEDGVRVLSVFLGRTATPMQVSIHRMENKEYRPERLIQPEDVAQVILNALQLPKSAEMTDVHLRPMQKPLS